MNDPFVISLPAGFTSLSPWLQAGVLGVLTFLQEDAPTIGSALLASVGTISWGTAFTGCFLGIWVGDALLYGLARGLGRGWLATSWARRFWEPAAVERSERWFAERGNWLLVASRFVPGTRLPTYLAAGFLRMPFGRFLLVTGLAVGIWTTILFLLAWRFGGALRGMLPSGITGALALISLIALVLWGWRRISGRLAAMRWIHVRTAVERWTRWEFWPAWLFYGPVVLNYLRLAVKYRGWTVPTAANPGLYSGGIVGESKMATLSELLATSPEFTPPTFLLKAGCFDERWSALEKLRHEQGFEYPYILKPDVGQRGVGVKLIRSEEQGRDYLSRTHSALVVQRYVPGPQEAGIFYYRMPGQARGKIFAITRKVFPMIKGDGHKTLEELIWSDDRARFMASTYLSRLGERSHAVPGMDESVRLVEAGNHAQGCIFEDGNEELFSHELETVIDSISRQLNGFFIGRYDVRYESDSDLRAGRGFQILELNGAASEATSIYDSRKSLGSAYATLFQQWELVFSIGAANRRGGSGTLGAAALWRSWRETTRTIQTYPQAD